jgi:hypothetical protein
VCSMHDRNQAPRRVDQPEPGFFALRMRKGAWPVPARIHHENGLWWATVDGKEHPAHDDPFHAPWVSRIWEGGELADEADYRWRLATKAAAAKSDPTHPCLHPMDRINRMVTGPSLPPSTTQRQTR